MEFFRFGNLDSDDEGVYIDQSRIFIKPEKDVEFVSVPGRNGDLSFTNNRYNNVEIVVNCCIKSSFADNYASFIGKLNAPWREGYQKLSFTAEPDVYREAQFVSAVDPKTGGYNEDAQFELRFNCKPQKFLQGYDNWIEITENGSILNPTLTNPSYMNALPVFQTKGNGTFYVKDSANQLVTTITVSGLGANDYTEIDSDIQDCYFNKTNRNPNVTMTNGFPVFPGGNATIISFTGFTSLKYKPKYWRL